MTRPAMNTGLAVLNQIKGEESQQAQIQNFAKMVHDIKTYKEPDIGKLKDKYKGNKFAEAMIRDFEIVHNSGTDELARYYNIKQLEKLDAAMSSGDYYTQKLMEEAQHNTRDGREAMQELKTHLGFQGGTEFIRNTTGQRLSEMSGGERAMAYQYVHQQANNGSGKVMSHYIPPDLQQKYKNQKDGFRGFMDSYGAYITGGAIALGGISMLAQGGAFGGGVDKLLGAAGEDVIVGSSGAGTPAAGGAGAAKGGLFSFLGGSGASGASGAGLSIGSILKGAGAAASVVQGVSSIYGGLQQGQMAQEQAGIKHAELTTQAQYDLEETLRNADIIEAEANEQADFLMRDMEQFSKIRQREMDQHMGQMKVDFLANGLQLEGTPMQFIEEQSRLDDEEMQTIYKNAETQSSSIRNIASRRADAMREAAKRRVHATNSSAASYAALGDDQKRAINLNNYVQGGSNILKGIDYFFNR